MDYKTTFVYKLNFTLFTKANSKCKQKECRSDQEEDLAHALLDCQANDGVGGQLLECLRVVQPGLQAEAALRLDLQVEDDEELPLVWIIATVLSTLWNLRQSGSKIRRYLIRAQMEASINILRDTRHKDVSDKIERLAENFFN